MFTETQVVPSGDTSRHSRRLEEALAKQEELKKQEYDVERDGYSMHFLPGAEEQIPEEFVEGAYEFALRHGELLKHAERSESGEEGINEVVWKFPGKEGKAFVLKLVQTEKMPTPDHELRILQRAELLKLPAPHPLGMMRVGDMEYTMMDYADGRSGQDIWLQLPQEGWTPEEIKKAKHDAKRIMEDTADRFRTEMAIDKKWYIKDFLLKFDGHRLVSMFPLDWERGEPYNPNKPGKIVVDPKDRTV